MCKFVEQNIWQYIDRELSARRIAEISAHLQSCEQCAGLYEGRAREATMYRLAFMASPFGRDFSERFEAGFNAWLDEHPGEAHEHDTRGGSRGRAAVRGRRGSFIERLTAPLFAHPALTGLAAMFLVALTVLSIVSNRPETGFDPVASAPRSPATSSASRIVERPRDVAVAVLRDGSDDGRAGRSIYAGVAVSSSDALDEGNAVVLEIDDGSTIEFARHRDWRFRVREGIGVGGPFVADIERGTLLARVAPREHPDHFTLMTPHAEIRVLGTEFSVEVAPEGTKVKVNEGTVRVTCLVTGRFRELSRADALLEFPLPPEPAPRPVTPPGPRPMLDNPTTR